MSMPAISKHLKVLERAGLMTKTRDAQWRLCRLDGSPLRDVAGWMEPYRRYWDESFTRLDEHLQRMKEGKEKSR
jgi:DNA-binding transcriptional ArsR family regulator